MSVRIIKILLVASVAAWGLLDGIGNIVVYDTWVKIVAFVLALENTMIDGELSARAITNPVLPHIGYAFIYLSKITAGILCSVSAFKLWQARNETSEIFQDAKSHFYMGCGIVMFMLIFGFIVLKGTVFNTGLEPSEFTMAVYNFVTLYLAMLVATLIYVSLPEPKKQGN